MKLILRSLFEIDPFCLIFIDSNFDSKNKKPLQVPDLQG